jgi:hypothetical protein
MMLKRLLVAAALGSLVLAGCGTDSEPEPTSSEEQGTSDAAASGAQALLAEHGLGDLAPVALVDHLDRLAPEERPQGLMVSVRADELLVSSGEEEHSMPLPEDKFYVSMAPYVDQTHECFYHSLTTCLGEMQAEEVQVEIVEDGATEPLVDETVTTFDNGFAGFWLPKDVEGTIRITSGDKEAEVDFSTDAEAPTCLTTVQLA